MQLRMFSPGCVGFTIWSLRQSVVINQVPVHRLSIDKAEDNAPVARDAHAPLPAPVALQRMQSVARQSHVLGRLRRRQFCQDTTDTASQVLRRQPGIVPFGWSLPSFVHTPNAAQICRRGTLCCKSCGLKPIARRFPQIVRPVCCFHVEIITLTG